MMQGLLIAWFLLTSPLVAYIAHRVYKMMKGRSKRTSESQANSEIILHAIHLFEKSVVQWLKSIRDSQDEAKIDHQAMLQATKAIAQSMLDIKDIANKFSQKPSPHENIESFVHSLEYARDTFAKTPTQRKAVESIISHIRTTHGAESK